MTTIKALRDMHNMGLCFTKGKKYKVDSDIKTEAGLIDVSIKNDLGQRHTIGSWWRNFKIVKNG